MTAWKQDQDLVIIPNNNPIYKFYEESGMLYDMVGVEYDYALFDVGSNSNILWENELDEETAWGS